MNKEACTSNQPTTRGKQVIDRMRPNRRLCKKGQAFLISVLSFWINQLWRLSQPRFVIMSFILKNRNNLKNIISSLIIPSYTISNNNWGQHWYTETLGHLLALFFLPLLVLLFPIVAKISLFNCYAQGTFRNILFVFLRILGIRAAVCHCFYPLFLINFSVYKNNAVSPILQFSVFIRIFTTNNNETIKASK